MSGLGFENCGCSIAHGIGNVIASLPEGKKALHGERVAFGTICQLIAVNYSNEKVIKILELCISIRLPVSLVDLGIKESKINVKKMLKFH